MKKFLILSILLGISTIPSFAEQINIRNIIPIKNSETFSSILNEDEPNNVSIFGKKDKKEEKKIIIEEDSSKLENIRDEATKEYMLDKMRVW